MAIVNDIGVMAKCSCGRSFMVWVQLNGNNEVNSIDIQHEDCVHGRLSGARVRQR